MPTGLSCKTPWFSWMGGPHLKETPNVGVWDAAACRLDISFPPGFCVNMDWAGIGIMQSLDRRVFFCFHDFPCVCPIFLCLFLYAYIYIYIIVLCICHLNIMYSYKKGRVRSLKKKHSIVIPMLAFVHPVFRQGFFHFASSPTTLKIIRYFKKETLHFAPQKVMQS